MAMRARYVLHLMLRACASSDASSRFLLGRAALLTQPKYRTSTVGERCCVRAGSGPGTRRLAPHVSKQIIRWWTQMNGVTNKCQCAVSQVQA